MKNILITGGAGFIGSNFVRYILSNHKDVQVINIDDLTYAGDLTKLWDVENNSRYQFVKGNIRDRELVEAVLRDHNIDTIVNFAAHSHVDNSIENAGEFIENNVLGTFTLLESAKKYWTIGKDPFGYPKYRDGVKFVQMSTDEVYGSAEDGRFFTEESKISPSNPYSASKGSADLIVSSYFKTYKLPINIVRSTNNFGPNQHEEKLIPKVIYHALNHKKIPIYGDGQQVRDWIYVLDTCSAIDLVIEKGVYGEVYNIGANNERTNIDMVKLILDKLEKPYDLMEFVPDRLGHDQRYGIDNTKLIREIGFKPKYSFEQGIETLLSSYRNKR